MAGKSPGKVEREKSSGEATEERVTEPPDIGRGAAEADEPSGADTEGDGAGGEAGDERLAAAVAAWVAGSDAKGAAEEAGDSESPQSAVASGSAGDAEEEPDTSAASDLPVRPRKADSKQAAAGTVDQPTAMFQVLDTEQSGRSSSSETDEEEAVRRAENMTAAFFGTSKAATTHKAAEPADAEREPEKAEGSPEPAETAEERPVDEPTAPFRTRGAGKGDAGREPADEAREKPVDEPTAAFRTRGPEQGEDGTAGSGKSARAKSPAASGGGRKRDPRDRNRLPDTEESAEERGSKSGRAGGKSASEESAESEQTAVIPAVSGKAKSGSAEPKSAKESAKESGKKPASGKPSEAGESEQTAVIPAVSGKAKSGSAEPKSAGEPAKESGKKPAPGKPSEAGESEQTAVIPAVSAKAKAKGDEGESESERTSQFVPLKSDDEPRVPKKAGPVVPPRPLGESRVGSGGAKLRPPSAGALPGEAAPQLSEAELTRQQPRPDQAPIDLLAQLTNRPPPEETPLRVAVRRVKVWTPLVLLVAVVFMVVQAVRPLPEPELKLTASGTYTFEGGKPTVPWPSEGQAVLDVDGLGSLGSFGEEKPVPIASVAKVMTAYVILRDHPVKKGGAGETIPVDQKAEDEAGLSAQNESTVEVKKGDKITQREAVQAIMIASANNVARLLARWDAGSEEAFVKKMNAAAKDLGMKNTHYTDPSGLNASTVSTAADQVKLGKKAMSIDLFRETVRMPGYSDTKGAKHGNWNRLVPLDGVVGIKTGTTTKAGGNLLFAAEKEIGGTRQLIIGAVLGQYRPSILDTVLGESKKLIDTAQDAMTARKVVKKGDVVGYVDDGLDGRTPVVATKDVTAVGWPGLEVELGLNDGGKVIPNEASEGDEVGTLTVGDGPGQVRVPVALAADSSEPGFGARMGRFL